MIQASSSQDDTIFTIYARKKRQPNELFPLHDFYVPLHLQ